MYNTLFYYMSYKTIITHLKEKEKPYFIISANDYNKLIHGQNTNVNIYTNYCKRPFAIRADNMILVSFPF